MCSLVEHYSMNMEDHKVVVEIHRLCCVAHGMPYSIMWDMMVKVEALFKVALYLQGVPCQQIVN